MEEKVQAPHAGLGALKLTERASIEDVEKWLDWGSVARAAG